MDVFALSLRIKEEGAATVKAATDKLRGSFDAAAKGADKLDKSSNQLRSTLTRLAGAFAVGATIKKFVDATSAAQFGQATLAQAIRTTAGEAGQSVTSLNDHAAALARMSTFSAGAINTAQARLLTYTNIVGERFPQATEAVLDYAQAFSVDLVQASEAVGKALNYPSVGMAALAKQGFILTDAQKALIKELEATGRMAEAQAIILDELKSVTEGQAIAARDTLGGALAALKNAFGDLFELTEKTTGSFTRFINRMAFMVTELNNNRGAMIQLAGGITIAVVALTALAFRAEIAAARIAILTAVETIAAFGQLARSIGIAAAAMELLGKAGPMRIAGIAIALGAAGAAAFGLKKAIDGSSDAFAEFEKRLAELDKTVMQPLAQTVTAMTEAVVDQVAALMKLVQLTTVTRVEAGLLAREERTLRQQLAAGNLTYAKRVELLERLRDVEQARATMQVRLTRDELMAAEFSTEGMIGMRLPGKPIPQIRGKGAGVPSVAASLKALESDAAMIRARTAASIDATKTLLAEQLDEMRVGMMEFADSIANTLVDSLASGIETAIASGSLGEGFKALTNTLLSGLGSALISFGRTAIMASALMKKFMAAMKSMNPFAAIAAGIGMVALGSMLRGAAQRSFAMNGGGSGSMAMAGGLGSLGIGGGSSTTSVTRFAPTTAGGAGASVATAQPMNITIIGPNDPSAQRAIASLMDNAARRGLVQGAGVRTL
jgi:hypothetical protein